ncbi:uncharacterized protein LOC116350039 isoform X2 [Contarinia nasturtii]|uniref:uncharacterized protein LOC116350039 isoform X2 n=1 Tax=Contarinia nasturtii TaxID=265458 RepID=UPI0012D3E65A|nr:uncharacterized protein LOC116350039 isoform X2 [Contarinia nasturtii]
MLRWLGTPLPPIAPPSFAQTYFFGGWMTIATNMNFPNIPPGLEYLTTINQLLVKQKVELLEAFTGFETNNKFTIKNSLGQKESKMLHLQFARRRCSEIFLTFIGLLRKMIVVHEIVADPRDHLI